jgi:hypothetical protein
MYLRNLFFRNLNSQTESVVHPNQKPQGSGFLGVVQKTVPDQIIDASAGFLDQTSGEYRLTIYNYLLYFDSNHLTIEGNKAAYADKIAAIFAGGSQKSPQ